MTSSLQEIKNILSYSPAERLNIIMSSNDPKAIVETMPDEELWLTIKTIGEHDSLPILAHASAEQTQYFLDIELWKRSSFLKEKSLEWLALLKECGEKKVLQWVYEGDADLVVLTIKEFVCIMKKETSDDNPLEREWPSNIPPATMDGSYYYQCDSMESDEVIRPILELVARSNYEFFIKLCESVMMDQKSNLEESAFSWRTKRLSEKGFVPLEEALEVYKYLNDRQIAQLPKRKDVSGETELRRAVYPLALGGESYPVFMLALSEIKNEAFHDGVMMELITLANKIVMADARPITPETIESSLKKAMGYVNIGLEHLSGADIHKAGRVLKEYFLVNLLQIGFSLITKARQHARKFVISGWPVSCDGDLSLLDDNVAMIINGILRKRPLFFSGESEEKPYREFKSIDDIREVERNVERADYIGRMFQDVFGLKPSDVMIATNDRENFKWSNVLLTIWAKGTAGGSFKFAPLDEDELNKVLKKVWRSDGDIESSIRSFKVDMGEKFLQLLLKKQPKISKNEENICKIFAGDCFSRFLEEFGELSGRHPLDWRYIQSIWVMPKAD
jgi:hypothetical protein